MVDPRDPEATGSRKVAKSVGGDPTRAQVDGYMSLAAQFATTSARPRRRTGNHIPADPPGQHALAPIVYLLVKPSGHL